MTMFARSDTYINVYLPREDGLEPRRYERPNSPLFEEDSIYKFSDEIVKDRKLFLGRKQVSLYDIYYKDGGKERNLMNTQDSSNEPTDAGGQDPEGADSTNGSEGESRTLPRFRDLKEQPQQGFPVPRVNKISLSLERRLRRSQKLPMPRFNEPMAYYGSNRPPHAQLSHTLDRQTNSLDTSTRRKNRVVTQGTSRVQNISKLFSKAQSAPADVRQVRVLGLPPISRSTTNLTGATADYSEPLRVQLAHARTLPIRPSSKPYKIWRQSNHPLKSGVSTRSEIGPTIKRLHTGSSRVTTGSYNDGVWA